MRKKKFTLTAMKQMGRIPKGCTIIIETENDFLSSEEISLAIREKGFTDTVSLAFCLPEDWRIWQIGI